MVNLIRLIFFVVVAVGCFRCAPVPVEPGTNTSFSIRLSLEKAGNLESEFSGEPIIAIVETPDTIMFSDLKWQQGAGIVRTADTTLLKKRRKFTALLSWNSYPLKRDSVDKMYYDTIYIGMGGNLYRSNSVRVKVSNLPVIIDSMKVGVTTFKPGTGNWAFTVPDSISKLHIRMFARDLDGKTLDMQVTGNSSGIEQSITQPLQLVYYVPPGQFQNTLTFIVSDYSRGQVLQKLSLSRTYPNVAPVIDSVSINTKVYKFTSSVTRGTWRKIDTLRFTAFVHDQYDTVKTITWRSSKNSIKNDSLRPEMMMYICTTSVCKDTISTKTSILDTIWLIIHDTKKDSAKSAIILQKGIPNRSPVIDTLYANSISVIDTGSIIPIINGNGLKSILFRVSATDPDNSPLHYSWNSKPGTLSTKTDSIVTYTIANALVNDTVSVTVTDKEFSVVKKVVVSVTDLIPVLDSIVIDSVRYKNISTSLTHYVSPGKQMIITAYARDPDVKDTMKYIWQMSDMTMFVSKTNNRVIVKLLSKTYSDTVRLKIQDGTVVSNYSLLIQVAPPEPVIDSIRVDTKIFKATTDTISDSISYPDTVQMAIFAHDNQMDILTYTFSSIVYKKITAVDTTTFNYITRDSTYTDTVKVTVSDSKGNKTAKNITLKIKGVTK